MTGKSTHFHTVVYAFIHSMKEQRKSIVSPNPFNALAFDEKIYFATVLPTQFRKKYYFFGGTLVSKSVKRKVVNIFPIYFWLSKTCIR